MKKYNIKIDVFDMNILIYLDNDTDKLQEEVKKIEKKEDRILANDFAYDDCLDWMTCEIDRNIYILSIDKPEVYMHEFYHAISFIYETIGLPMSRTNDEFWAYILTYIIKEMNKNSKTRKSL